MRRVFALREAPGSAERELSYAAYQALDRPEPDLSPLMVYADWLLERGAPSGEYVVLISKGVKEAVKAANEIYRRIEELEKIPSAWVNDSRDKGVAETLKRAAEFIDSVVLLASETTRMQAHSAVDKFSDRCELLRFMSTRHVYHSPEYREKWIGPEQSVDGLAAEDLGPVVPPEAAKKLQKFAHDAGVAARRCW